MEMVEPMVHAHCVVGTSFMGDQCKIAKVSFMGSGEPLMNYRRAVIAACKFIGNPSTFNLSGGQIMISTFGIMPWIFELMHDLPQSCGHCT
jgi:adenine C2-methylase RlmN of 23S rRNA A2503 and tRNA A37